jgi:CRISPR-associated protein Csd1
VLLKRLKEYNFQAHDNFDDEEMPAEYSSQSIPWIVEIDSSSGHASIIRTSGGTSKRDTGKRFNVPFLKRSGTNIKPQLLADKAEMALGIEADDPDRARKRHADFVALLDACAQATADRRVHAVAAFLHNLSQQPLELPQDLQANDFITFAVDGIRLVDLQSVRRFWLSVAPLAV